jgi:glycosyltransferase involved in cell wall biosynthesis
MDRPGISVVVPSYNHAEFIRETLDSILDQQYPAVDVLVMDGGSSDGTVNILREYGDRIRWISRKDGGQTDALIKGFADSRGSILTWLNSDDIMCNRSLWLVAEAWMEGEVDVVYGEGHYMDRGGERTRAYPTVAISPEYSADQAFFEKGYVAQPSVYFSKTAYDAVGGLSACKNLCMDYDLWVRLARSGAVWRRLPADISGNRWYEDTKTVSQQLDLLAEIVGTQVDNYGGVSSYFVQSISDFLYARIHSRNFGDGDHIFVRSIYFKAVWCALNYRSPKRTLEGLLFRNIAATGPIVADYISQDRFLEALAGHLSQVAEGRPTRD